MSKLIKIHTKISYKRLGQIRKNDNTKLTILTIILTIRCTCKNSYKNGGLKRYCTIIIVQDSYFHGGPYVIHFYTKKLYHFWYEIPVLTISVLLCVLLFQMCLLSHSKYHVIYQQISATPLDLAPQVRFWLAEKTVAPSWSTSVLMRRFSQLYGRN